MLRKALLCIGFLLLPSSACAMQQTMWDFRDSQTAGEWQIQGLGSVVPTPQGVHITAEKNGFMLRDLNTGRRIDGVRIVAQARQETEGLMLWHKRGTAPNEVVQLSFLLRPGIIDQVSEDLSVYGDWDPHADRFGIALPAGADVTIQTITFFTMNPLEKLSGAWQTFWTFDSFSASSINFLWGPIVRFIPADASSIFGSGPPHGWSGNRILYGLLVLVGAGAYGWARLRRKKSPSADARALALFASVALGLWIFSDLRMGLEILNYARSDLHTTLAPKPGARTFRAFGNFYDAVDRSVPTLQQQPTYGVLLAEGAPLRSRLQYFTYPSIPVDPPVGSGTKLWFVYGRPDVTVDDAGNLQLRSGTVFASKGRILERFDESSFLYQAP